MPIAAFFIGTGAAENLVGSGYAASVVGGATAIGCGWLVLKYMEAEGIRHSLVQERKREDELRREAREEELRREGREEELRRDERAQERERVDQLRRDAELERPMASLGPRSGLGLRLVRKDGSRCAICRHRDRAHTGAECRYCGSFFHEFRPAES